MATNRRMMEEALLGSNNDLGWPDDSEDDLDYEDQVPVSYYHPTIDHRFESSSSFPQRPNPSTSTNTFHSLDHQNLSSSPFPLLNAYSEDTREWSPTPTVTNNLKSGSLNGFNPDHPGQQASVDHHRPSDNLVRVYGTNHNVLITAPTGSGKTILFELAILRMLEYNPVRKAVYMAPTKSLCAERFRDWSHRFSALGIKTLELTGDSEYSGLTEAKTANIIVTTPEKWDGMTRRWFEFPKLLNNLKLVCIDEVHMLNEERGSVLEVIVARMKTLGTNIRFIALSATIPNVQDLAEWIGDGSVTDAKNNVMPDQGVAQTFIFGEEYRPIKLEKLVYGFNHRKEQSEYQFMSLLNFKLIDMIISHSSGKPTLIFCGTRKSALQAAETLSKAYKKTIDQGNKPPWNSVPGMGKYADKNLEDLSQKGIGIHHAGLEQLDRKQVEESFLNGRIKVLCTTSTLSVGVNLPARCVIIRGTRSFKGANAKSADGFEDYSELDLAQMMGRAGRPQFDTEGVAVIMTSQADKVRIEKINLTEHLNSEVNMGTITSQKSAVEWINNSFLAVRIKKNPKHYSIGDTLLQSDRQLEEFVKNSLKLLITDNLIEEEEQDIKATELGQIMSKFCLRHKTFLNIVGLKADASVRNILEALSQADEYSTLRFRAGEAAVYKKLNENPQMRFSHSGRINTASQKAVLGGIPLTEAKTENNNPQMEANIIWQHLPRLCKGTLSLSIARRDVSTKNCLELLRSVNARAWENTPWVLRQLDQIGEKSVKRLAESGISNLKQLQETSESRLELASTRSMPQFFCRMFTISEELVEYGVRASVEIEVGLREIGQTPVWSWKNATLMATVFVITSDQQWIEFRNIRAKLLVEVKRFTIECTLVKPSQSILAYVACSQIAGIGCIAKWTASTPREKYPKPKLISEEDAAIADTLEGLNSKDFDTSGEESLGEIRLATSRKKKTPALRNENRGLDNESENFGSLEHVSKTTVLESREKLENGRYRCAHKCKGACNHYCCRHGVSKPTKTQRERGVHNTEPGAKDSKKPSARKSPKSNPSGWSSIAPLKKNIGHMPHTEDSSPSKALIAGNNSLPSNQQKTLARPKSAVVDDRKNDHFKDFENLPDLEDLMNQDISDYQMNPIESLKDKYSHRGSCSGNNSNIDFNEGKLNEGRGKEQGSLGYRNLGDENSRAKSENKDLPLGAGTLTSGVARFRNQKKTVDDFDERQIFNRLIKTPSDANIIKRPFSSAPKSSTTSEFNKRSESPEITIVTEQNRRLSTELSTPDEKELDEVDELDEDYDESIFRKYLVDENNKNIPRTDKKAEKDGKRRLDDFEDFSPAIAPKKIARRYSTCSNFDIDKEISSKEFLEDDKLDLKSSFKPDELEVDNQSYQKKSEVTQDGNDCNQIKTFQDISGSSGMIKNHEALNTINDTEKIQDSKNEHKSPDLSSGSDDNYFMSALDDVIKWAEGQVVEAYDSKT
ncbi:hypothetical protein PPACK8108_LOCUS14425 [Phakopsora pachyrhizi]|uniref:DNA 3'-5' helicase n=1 Tax=Phakopsora pachyrhizi TaxID=170000 RepID=A0AAV0B9U3_PHAPC|nr:hypothetical protein PPACK8108_LOCUS14425 [Phakopsora pachyrhizi]